MRLGSSPRARGADTYNGCFPCKSGIIPARAGSRPAESSYPPNKQDHPRARGEQIRRAGRFARCLGSSPRARGAGKVVENSILLVGIIPARAGSSPNQRPARAVKRDHPRARGEQQLHVYIQGRMQGSSPRARGAVLDALMHFLAGGIIPARAGSSSRLRRHIHIFWDHPRARGEQASERQTDLRHRGSSPRARGADSSYTNQVGTSGIIPARAGSRLKNPC